MKRIGQILAALVMILMPWQAGIQAGPIDITNAVSLNFEDTPIATVLRMLAAQNNLNMVISAAVDGNISISLDNVALGAALDAVLLPNGYNYYVNNDIIIVKEADRKVIGELTAQSYRLRYIDAASAESAITPLLSPNGQVIRLAPKNETPSADKPDESSQIVVVDYPSVHGNIAGLLAQIDRKRQQVSVEVKIIETNLSDQEKLGINWPTSISASINGAPSPGGSDEGNGGEAAVKSLENGDWQLGYLSVHQVDLVLDYLKERQNTKLLSNPRLTTMENETATIKIQTVIPIPTVNRFSEGAVIQDIVTFQDKEVGISLKVTPRINGDSAIIMRVNPVVEEIIEKVYVGESWKPITSERSIVTTVTVRNNETLALGGLLKDSRYETKTRVFLLGSIPVLGALFTHTKTETKTTDLLILITPRIID